MFNIWELVLGHQFSIISSGIELHVLHFQKVTAQVLIFAHFLSWCRCIAGLARVIAFSRFPTQKKDLLDSYVGTDSMSAPTCGVVKHIHPTTRLDGSARTIQQHSMQFLEKTLYLLPATMRSRIWAVSCGSLMVHNNQVTWVTFGTYMYTAGCHNRVVVYSTSKCTTYALLVGATNGWVRKVRVSGRVEELTVRRPRFPQEYFHWNMGTCSSLRFLGCTELKHRR